MERSILRNNKKMLNSQGLYGFVKQLSGKDPRNFQQFEGKGLLQGIKCEVDGKGNDHKRLACQPPNIGNFRVMLVNRLDKKAEKTTHPQLGRVPTLKNPNTSPVFMQRLQIKTF